MPHPTPAQSSPALATLQAESASAQRFGSRDLAAAADAAVAFYGSPAPKVLSKLANGKQCGWCSGRLCTVENLLHRLGDCNKILNLILGPNDAAPRRAAPRPRPAPPHSTLSSSSVSRGRRRSSPALATLQSAQRFGGSGCSSSGCSIPPQQTLKTLEKGPPQATWLVLQKGPGTVDKASNSRAASSKTIKIHLG